MSSRFSETFNKADGALGPNLTWTRVDGAASSAATVVSNQIKLTTTGNAEYRAEHDAATTDQYAAIDIIQIDPDATDGSEVGVYCRYASAASTGYFVQVDANASAGAATLKITKIVTGTFTNLFTSATFTPSLTARVFFRCKGTNLLARLDQASGAPIQLSGTDGSITTGTRGGIHISSTNAATRIAIGDNFEFGDFGSLAALPPRIRSSLFRR